MSGKSYICLLLQVSIAKNQDIAWILQRQQAITGYNTNIHNANNKVKSKIVNANIV